MKNRITIIYCGLLLTLAAFSMDILLPAFTLIADDLNAPMARVQLVVPFFLASVGLGQLINGSLSDRFGRRRIIILGLSVYLCGVVLVYLAPTIELLLAGRILQGLGSSAGPAVARAIIRDIYSGRELARNIALATAVFAFGPIVAPLMGATFLLYFEWRSLLVLMALFAATLLLFAIFVLPETIRKRNPNATKVSTIITNTGRMFSNPQSRFYLLLSAITIALVMTILINISAIYHLNFGVTGMLFAILFAVNGLGIIFGQMINRRVLSTMNIEKVSLISAILLVAITAVFVITSATGTMTAWMLALLLTLQAAPNMAIYANAATQTLEPHEDIAGFTSSFYGFFSQVTSSFIGIAVSIFVLGNLVIWSTLLLGFAVITLAALYWRMSRQTGPDPQWRTQDNEAQN